MCQRHLIIDSLPPPSKFPTQLAVRLEDDIQELRGMCVAFWSLHVLLFFLTLSRDLRGMCATFGCCIHFSDSVGREAFARPLVARQSISSNVSLQNPKVPLP
jgi:hypothetical protein